MSAGVVSDPREPAPLAPPEEEVEGGDVDTEAIEGVAVGIAAGAAGFSRAVNDESTPLPPALPYHIADPTGWSMEKLVPVETEPTHPEDEAALPAHSRGAQTPPPADSDPASDGEVDESSLTTPQRAIGAASAEQDDEQTRPRARVPGPGDPSGTR